MRAAFPQRLAAQGCPRDARIFIDNVEDLFGHEGANRVLKGCDGVRPDRVSTDAVNNQRDRTIAAVLVPPAGQEGAPVDADDVPARNDHEPVDAFQHAERGVVAAGASAGFFEGRGGDVDHAVAGA